MRSAMFGSMDEMTAEAPTPALVDVPGQQHVGAAGGGAHPARVDEHPAHRGRPVAARIAAQHRRDAASWEEARLPAVGDRILRKESHMSGRIYRVLQTTAAGVEESLVRADNRVQAERAISRRT